MTPFLLRNLLRSLRFTSSAVVLALSACTPETPPTPPTPPRQSLSQRLDASKPEPSSYKQDSDGKWQAQTGKRSPYEGKTDPNFANKDFNKQPYKTQNFSKKSWWGTQPYAAGTQSYAGNTDASRLQKSAPQQGQDARETRTTSSLSDQAYTTRDFATRSARETNAAAITKGNNDNIENRRKSFIQPEITDWTQRRDLSLDQTKSILGR